MLFRSREFRPGGRDYGRGTRTVNRAARQGSAEACEADEPTAPDLPDRAHEGAGVEPRRLVSVEGLPVHAHAPLRDQAPRLGPAGGEYLLVALGGCFTSHLLAAIRAREAAMTAVKVEVAGTMDGSPEKFVDFTVNVTAECADADLAVKLITIAARACQVMNTLRQATPVEIGRAHV